MVAVERACGRNRSKGSEGRSVQALGREEREREGGGL